MAQENDESILSNMVIASPKMTEAMVGLAKMLPQITELIDRLSKKNDALELELQHYDKKRVAELFGVNTRQIERWVKEGKLHPMYFGESNKSHMRFSHTELQRFAEVNKRLSATPNDEATVLANAMPTRSKRKTL